MTLAQQPSMAFSRNEQYLNSGQFPVEQMLWDMPSTGTSTLLSSRSNAATSDMSPFSPVRKSIQSGFATTSTSANEFRPSDSNYSSFNNPYSSSMFGGSRNDREFQRSNSPMSGPSGMPTLSHSSSSSGLANMTMGYVPPSSRPLNVNGSFSRSISSGQSPSATTGFGSSYTANSFAPNQYSGQTQSQSSTMNSFNMNAMKVGFDDLSTRNNFLKRQQDTKRSTGTMGIPNFGSSLAFMRGNVFTSSNGSDEPIFDISDFPSLSSRSRLENSMSFANVLTQGPKTGYGLNKQGGSDASTEFQMHSEDFPALPGAEGGSSLPAFEKDKGRGITGDSSGSGDRTTPNSAPVLTTVNSINHQLNYAQPSSAASMNTYFQTGPALSQGMPPLRRMMAETGDRPMAPIPSIRRLDESKDFLSSAGSKTTFVPPSIVQDHFGLFGFLQYMKCLSANSSLPLTSVGCDLHALGLVFNPLDAAPKRFKGYPFLHSYINEACTAHICHLGREFVLELASNALLVTDVDVPYDYLVSITMQKDKVVPPRIGKFSEDLLFYLFYGFPGDIMQYAAAMELYTRDWRFHKEEKIWITRIPNQPPIEKTATYERGQYQYFDSLGWRKAAKEMHVEYAKLEERVSFPPNAVQLMPNLLHSLFN